MLINKVIKIKSGELSTLLNKVLQEIYQNLSLESFCD